ncbi:MAG: manganese efflux pump [Rhodospirillales bacterium]|nr:manganese efflux pump [Rhodospirillales bacterium]
MTFSTLILIALGLSMDAFGASVGRSASVGRYVHLADILKVGFLFGAFAALAPLIGWAIGRAFYSLIEAYDHWIAFALLSVVGLKMVRDGWINAETNVIAHSYRLLVIVGAAIATSIDAVAVGITLPTFHVNVLLAACVIGLVTLLASIFGSLLGRIAGEQMGRRAEILGGIVLIAIGARILIAHIYFPAGAY